mmetsp:Transcript_13657/g.21383  ORF Transcript_13657/g.21383 Transcript_13657/m.21383 type:complete len:321 (-) Transcript_13657:59-1021(-)
MVLVVECVYNEHRQEHQLQQAGVEGILRVSNVQDRNIFNCLLLLIKIARQLLLFGVAVRHVIDHLRFITSSGNFLEIFFFEILTLYLREHKASFFRSLVHEVRDITARCLLLLLKCIIRNTLRSIHANREWTHVLLVNYHGLAGLGCFLLLAGWCGWLYQAFLELSLIELEVRRVLLDAQSASASTLVNYGIFPEVNAGLHNVITLYMQGVSLFRPSFEVRRVVKCRPYALVLRWILRRREGVAVSGELRILLAGGSSITDLCHHIIVAGHSLQIVGRRLVFLGACILAGPLTSSLEGSRVFQLSVLVDTVPPLLRVEVC